MATRGGTARLKGERLTWHLSRESRVKKRVSGWHERRRHRASLGVPPSSSVAPIMITEQQAHPSAHGAAHGIMAATAMANLGISTIRNGP